jgi:hypothetical protein
LFFACVFGIPLPDIAVLLTIVYTVLMVAHLGWKFLGC